MATRFLVYVSPEGAAALCEGGVYSDAPQGEYEENTLELAAEHAAYNNRAWGAAGGRYETRAGMEGVAVDSTVRSSLEDWQLALITTETTFPRAFIDDCLECACDVGEVTKETARAITLRQSPAQREELESRARHYATGGLDMAPLWMTRSARAVLQRLA